MVGVTAFYPELGAGFGRVIPFFENLAIPDIVAFHGNIQLGDGIMVPRSPFDASQDLISISTRFELMLARPAFLFLYIRRNDRGNSLRG